MTRPRVLLAGAGHHAAVVAESARAGEWDVIGCLDDRPARDLDLEAVGLRHLGAIEDLGAVIAHEPAPTAVHAAAGDPARRRAWLAASEAAGAAPATIVHPTAIVSPSARLEPGVFVGPGVIVNARAHIARGAIVNSGAIVEHDCRLEAFCHVAPGAVLAGTVTVGEDALVGVGAAVHPGVRVGRAVRLGAGAVAVSDIPDGLCAIGVPARPR